MRYESRSGKFGYYFYDIKSGVEMTTDDVLGELNDRDATLSWRNYYRDMVRRISQILREAGFPAPAFGRPGSPDDSIPAAVAALVEGQKKAADEKARRVYYQDIVYGVCGVIDGVRRDGEVLLACGTVDRPNDNVIRAVRALVKKSPDTPSGEEDDVVSSSYHHGVVSALSDQLTHIKATLDRAGVSGIGVGGDKLSAAMRVEILAGRSAPHEPPGRTAYVRKLELVSEAAQSALDEMSVALCDLNDERDAPAEEDRWPLSF